MPQKTTTRPGGSWVVGLCWTTVLLDGFDLVVLGVVLPVLLSAGVWGLTPATATVVSTVGLIGMTIGALTIGTVADLIGRRRSLIISVTSFSACTALCALAPSAELFGLLRFLAGLGLGGALPTAITRVSEHYARTGRTSSPATLVMTGYHVGAVLTAFGGILLVPVFGWRAMFVVGALPAVVLVPLLVRHLTDEPATPVTSTEPARATREVVGSLFRDGMLRATLAFWAATFLGLVLVFGLNTWLPQIMRSAGYPLGAALALLLTLNVGAIVGLLLAGRVADRAGVRRTLVGWFAGAAVFLGLLSVRMPQVALYAAVFLAGCFVFSAQALVYAYTQQVYPPHARATGLGWTAGVGRLGAVCGPILAGALLAAGLAYPWGFYAFSLTGALAAASAAAVGRTSDPLPEGVTTS